MLVLSEIPEIYLSPFEYIYTLNDLKLLLVDSSLSEFFPKESNIL